MSVIENYSLADISARKSRVRKPERARDSYLPWTEERIAEMKRRWQDGESASQIAAVLGGTTRMAVLGKLDRLQRKEGRPITRASRPRCANKPRVRRSPAASPANPVIAEPLPPEPQPPSLAHKCDLFALRNDTCRWPLGDPGTQGFGFCGTPEADLAKQRPYCAFHEKLARGKQETLSQQRSQLSLGKFLGGLPARGSYCDLGAAR